jgi:hypothetical protein
MLVKFRASDVVFLRFFLNIGKRMRYKEFIASAQRLAIFVFFPIFFLFYIVFNLCIFYLRVFTTKKTHILSNLSYLTILSLLKEDFLSIHHFGTSFCFPC